MFPRRLAGLSGRGCRAALRSVLCSPFTQTSLSSFVCEMGSQISLLKRLRFFSLCFELLYFSAQSSAGSLLPVRVLAAGSGVIWIVFPLSCSLGYLSSLFLNLP